MTVCLSKNQIRMTLHVSLFALPYHIEPLQGYALGRKRASKDDGDPSLFIKAMEVLGVEPNECVAFGNELNDTKAAQNAGLAAYNCLWGETEDEAQTMTETMPTISLNAPADIIEILR